jgi:hypothetical protein
MSTVVSVPTNALADKTCADGPKAAALPRFSNRSMPQKTQTPLKTDLYVHGNV